MSQALVPFAEVKELARSVAVSGFFMGVQSPEQALTLMMIAQAEGCHPIQAMQRFHVIKGKPAKQSWAMLADFQSSGGKVDWHAHGPKQCKATFSHPVGGSITVDWTIEKAKDAGLLGNDTWRKYPENMLHARCVSNGVRFVFPAAANGLYTPEEVGDFDDKPAQHAPVQAKAAGVWDKFTTNEPAQNQEPPPAEAEYVESEPQHVAPVQPAQLAVPGDDCDRVPADMVALSRRLTATPFAEQSDTELTENIRELTAMARKAKAANNRAALTVAAAIASGALSKRGAA